MAAPRHRPTVSDVFLTEYDVHFVHDARPLAYDVYYANDTSSVRLRLPPSPTGEGYIRRELSADLCCNEITSKTKPFIFDFLQDAP